MGGISLKLSANNGLANGFFLIAGVVAYRFSAPYIKVRYLSKMTIIKIVVLLDAWS
jgi:hypothetical protein